MTKSTDTRERFIELRAEGWTLAKIADELDISRNTATGWNKDYQERIKAAHALRIEELQEKYHMAREKRIELFGERLLAIKEELTKRDLSEVPTPKLFDMMMKCEAALEKEGVNPVFWTDEDVETVKTKRLYREELYKALP